MSALLEVRDVHLSFGGVHAVAGASLQVTSNQLLGIIGPNGAGKTTLLRIITGVLFADQGQVLLDGVDVTRLTTVARVRLGLALAQQIVKPLRSLDLIDNVALAAGHALLRSPFRAMFRHSRTKERAAALEFLERVGLADVASRMPDELPLGYLKRLEVARALALSPRLLLLDEPLAGLNAGEAAAMADLIASLPSPTLSVVLIEHNLREVLRICPTLYVQDNGKPLALGPANEVMDRADVRQAYLGVSK
jgi:branched-chain amino acid transport system ATP-binding protein